MSKKHLTHVRNAKAQQNGELTRRDKAIISRIVYQFTARSRADIKKWRDAIAQAEQDRSPRRTKWADMVRDLDLDAHWTSQTLITRVSLMRKRYYIRDKKSKQENPEKTAMVQAPWFYKILNIWMDADLFGTQVAEIQDLVFGNMTESAVFVFPQVNIAPEEKLILLKSTDTFGVSYADEPYVIEFKESGLLGLLYKAAPHIIWKRNAQQSWAEFCEKFGIPMRYATTNKKDKTTLDRLEKMLDELGSAARAIFPEGTTIDFKEANTQDAWEVFDKMIERCNSEISKLVNAVTMISDNGSSLSQSKVHQEINQKIIDYHAARFQADVQWKIMPALQNLGFQIDPTKDEWVWDETEVLSMGALWNIVQGILKFYDVDEKWVVEKFKVPITGKRAVPIQDNTNGGNIPNNNLFETALSRVPAHIKKAVDEEIEKINASFNSAQPEPAPVEPRFDHAGYTKALSAHKSAVSALQPDVQNSIGSLFLKAAEAFFNSPSNKPSTLSDGEWNDLYKFVSQKMWGAVEKSYGKDLSDPDLESIDKDMLESLQKNMYVFSATKNFNLMLALNAELKDEDGKLREWTDFKTRAMVLNDQYNVNWLQTEYNTAVASAQGAAKWQTFWAERDQYDLKYQTVGDDRVRESHQSLDGVVRPVDDDFWDTHYPPLAFNCRCEVIQVSGETKTDKSKIISPDIPKMFRNNVGKTGQVFTKDHPYWKGLTTTEKNALDKLADKTINE
jgi:SPP1 gp7 family putative phage head morphogenesis protein